MPCTKTDLVTAINSYAAARATGDGPLMQLAVTKLTEMIDTLEFSEPEAAEDNGSQE
jgi:hypothetical protein